LTLAGLQTVMTYSILKEQAVRFLSASRSDVFVVAMEEYYGKSSANASVWFPISSGFPDPPPSPYSRSICVGDKIVDNLTLQKQVYEG
jgi:hypothetical protein